MTHLMGQNGLLGRRGVKRDALRIGQAPQRTQEAISSHRRPRSFARSPRCGSLVVGWRHGANRALRADESPAVKWVNINDLWYNRLDRPPITDPPSVQPAKFAKSPDTS